jgi:hypothetical protein
MDFKPNVLAALEKICTPFKMNGDYESWLRIAPLEIYSTAQLKRFFPYTNGHEVQHGNTYWSGTKTKFDVTKISLK